MGSHDKIVLSALVVVLLGSGCLTEFGAEKAVMESRCESLQIGTPVEQILDLQKATPPCGACGYWWPMGTLDKDRVNLYSVGPEAYWALSSEPPPGYRRESYMISCCVAVRDGVIAYKEVCVSSN